MTRDDVIDADDAIEAILNLRHAQDAGDRHRDEEKQHQGETQAQTHSHFHVR